MSIKAPYIHNLFLHPSATNYKSNSLSQEKTLYTEIPSNPNIPIHTNLPTYPYFYKLAGVVMIYI